MLNTEEAPPSDFTNAQEMKEDDSEAITTSFESLQVATIVVNHFPSETSTDRLRSHVDPYDTQEDMTISGGRFNHVRALNQVI